MMFLRYLQAKFSLEAERYANADLRRRVERLAEENAELRRKLSEEENYAYALARQLEETSHRLITLQ